METVTSSTQSDLQPMPAATGTDTPPWLRDDGIAQDAAPVRTTLTIRREPRVETVHWGVALLTLLTAAFVLFGTRGGEMSHPRELLPVMITINS